jgi:hypothetical protein
VTYVAGPVEIEDALEVVEVADESSATHMDDEVLVATEVLETSD